MGQLVCKDCGRPLRLGELDGRKAWICSAWPRCKGNIGADQKTLLPLGEPGDRETRRMRAQAHDVFDRLWKRGGSRAKPLMKRNMAYAWLAGAMRLTKAECHFALFTKEQCVEAIRAVRDFTARKEAAQRKAQEQYLAIVPKAARAKKDYWYGRQPRQERLYVRKRKQRLRDKGEWTDSDDSVG